ncbi:MAG: ABC transporter permease [Planctomycetota bacterium]|jgi:putative ABC transport system permease protein
MPWQLVFKNLWAHPIRTLLTLGSLVIAIFLICFLNTLVSGLTAGVKASASDRLIVQSAVSLFVELPESYQGKIDGVSGIERTCKMQWFGGYFREQRNFFAQFAIDHDRFFDTYPEVKMIEGSAEALARKRSGCIIGKELATKYGWKVGQRVPIIGTIFARKDRQPWEFEVVGIYESTRANVDQQTMWFRFDYLREAVESGAAGGPAGTGVFVLDLEDEADPVKVAGAVDALFDLGPQRVKATTEAEFQRQFVSMLGSVPTFLTGIGGGVLFAIVLAVVNTMLMSARQRTHDFGVLKALGFKDRVVGGLLMAESLLLCVLGGVAGIALALSSQPFLATKLSMIMPNYKVEPAAIALAAVVAVTIGLVSGWIPAWRVTRLKAVEAFRTEI